MNDTIKDLLDRIQHQEHQGIHTMSPCAKCFHPSRGGGPCGPCLRKELEGVLRGTVRTTVWVVRGVSGEGRVVYKGPDGWLREPDIRFARTYLTRTGAQKQADLLRPECSPVPMVLEVSS